ncbi:hypothetical protein SAMN04488515_3162 [Cognatiyoonia koreensis]|uniref:DUF2169 domain-containing protein n=1 Tax=Cognatiyoonia koreensis TaxID=364200 RepID=A0A1I0RSD9_9RHOB|nr:DUF2169 domain-containing protein [Cognatiyoonia koreensis]SEW44150.1 hypothetical protein SAMN04488515_3162 [Cognatiyoonia koreensis]
MQVRNLTPYAHLTYANEDADRRLFDILIVKATYQYVDGKLVTAIEQEPLNFSDTCFGAVNETPLRYPSDLVPYKPRADVIVIADAHAPDSKPAAQWDCTVQVGAMRHSVTVTGPRMWRYKRLGGWTLDEIEPATHVPLRYDYAFGGEHPGPDDTIITDERNPLGCGFMHAQMTPRDAPIPAPQVLEQGQKLRDPFRHLVPAGFGPIPPAWQPRRPLGGTYDQNWIDNIWPHWAPDYDFAFHNSAARGMKAEGFLRGDESVMLSNMHPDMPELRFDLPGDPVIAHLVDHDDQRRMIGMVCDTLYIDVLAEDPEDWLIALTWRMPFLDAGVKVLEIDSVSVANPIRMMSEDQTIYPCPHPSEVFSPLQVKEVANVQ